MKSSVEDLAKDVLAGDRRSLAKAITLIESTLADERAKAETLLASLAPKSGNALRIGITGAPGVGKSTFIEALGKVLLAQGKRVAVLAVDPTSPVTGGSILGDRVRMEDLSRDPRVFIRPTPSGASLGGVARHTRETILACEAAGHDVVLVETVGVGQSETLVASMVDLFLVLHLPNSGDEIQGMKKGLLELADVVAVTKSDGELLADAKLAKAQLEQALSFSTADDGPPPVFLISSTVGVGISELWTALETAATTRRKDGRFAERRAEQVILWFRSELGELLQERLRSKPVLAAALRQAETDVRSGKVAASIAAGRVLDQVLVSIGA